MFHVLSLKTVGVTEPVICRPKLILYFDLQFACIHSSNNLLTYLLFPTDRQCE